MTALRHKLLSFSCLAAVSVASGVTSAFAQETPETAPADEIIVTGQRGSVINSLDEKRKSESIADILSADQADRFPDQNIAEGLARIPGVSFQRQNDTGDGEFISIRGLDAGLNTVLFNGLRAGAADTGGGRRTPLDIITGSGVSSVKVTKSLLPEDPSEGIGGSVDIRTRGPLERSDSFSLSASGIQNSFEDRTGFRVSGRANKKFTDDFGINISASYRKRFFSNVALDPTSTPDLVRPVLLTGANGTNAVFLDEEDLELVPVGLVPFDAYTQEQLNYRFDDLERRNLSISGSVDWRVSDNTVLTLGGRFSRENIINTESEIEFDSDDTGDFFVPGEDDIVEGGDLLDTIFGTDDLSGFSTAEIQAGLAGVTAYFDDQEAVFEGEIQDEIETQARIFLRGETTTDNWDFSYIFGYSRAFEDSPDIEFEFDQEVVDLPAFADLVAANPTSSDEFIENANGFSPGDLSDAIFPNIAPRNAALFAELIDPLTGEADLEDANLELVNSVENERISARFDATRRFDSGPLEYFKLGFQWEQSDFTDIFIDIDGFFDDFVDDADTFGALIGDNRPIQAGDIFVPGELVTFDDIGGSPFTDVGFNGVPRANRAFLSQLRAMVLSDFAASGEDPDFFQTLDSRERFYSSYVQGKAVLGKLDIIAGVRVEYYDADFSAPIVTILELEDADGEDDFDFVEPVQGQQLTSTDNFEVLPRLALNYNLSDETKIRFGFSTALARPEFSELGADVETEVVIELDEVIALADETNLDDVEVFLSFGNPDLVNSYAYNFDLSFEHYFDDQNAISFAVFYKTIDNFIFQSPGIDAALNDALNASDIDPNLVLSNATFTAEGEAFLAQVGGVDAIIAAAEAQNNIIINQPQNGGTAEVYGLEFGLFHTFSYLPGFLADVGFIGNVTYQKTEIDVQLGVFDDDDALVIIGDAVAGEPAIQSFEFFNSPSVTGNAAIYYDANNIEATLAYRYAGSQFEAVETNGLSQFQRGRSFMDLDIEYDLPDNLFGDTRTQVFFSVSDLTDGGRKFSVSEASGSPTSILNNLSTFNGRTFSFGARVRF